MATVVDFVEPCARTMKKDSKPDSKAGKMTAVAASSATSKKVAAIKNETFEEMKREVLEMGAKGKSKKEQLKIREQKLIQIGCAPYKKPKTPLPILKAMKIKNAQKERKRKMEAREADVIAASSVGKRRKTS